MNVPSPLVSTDWLAQHLDDPDVRVADASWYLPQANRDPNAEYAKAHIPGAVFFDIEKLSDETSPLPHTLPPPAEFAARMSELGLGDDDIIVVYDGGGIYSSPRAWWMLKTMGHDKVAVLDGGLPKWRREGRPLDDVKPRPQPHRFTPSPDYSLVRDFTAVLQSSAGGTEQILDARSAARFAGREAEPRPGVRPGHIPGSLNLHYARLMTEDGTLKNADELRALFQETGLDPSRPVVTTCGSGITACTLLMALHAAGQPNGAVYDGSWSDWGGRPDAPIELGEP